MVVPRLATASTIRPGMGPRLQRCSTQHSARINPATNGDLSRLDAMCAQKLVDTADIVREAIDSTTPVTSKRRAEGLRSGLALRASIGGRNLLGARLHPRFLALGRRRNCLWSSPNQL